MATQTGVKDKYAFFYFDKLATACAEYKLAQSLGKQPRGPEPLQAWLSEVRAAMPDNLYNPFLRVLGELLSVHTSMICLKLEHPQALT